MVTTFSSSPSRGLEGLAAIYPARSRDGYTFTVSDTPILEPAREGPAAAYTHLGVMDARITCHEGTYYILYDAVGRHGYRLAIARTEDFTTAESLGFISEPDTKGGGLFPKKIKGKIRAYRTALARRQHMAELFRRSPLLGSASEVVMAPRGGFWDTSRIGVATPPMEIDEGWLIIYYGVKETSAGPLFRLGAAVLDAEDPSVVKFRTNIPDPVTARGIRTHRRRAQPRILLRGPFLSAMVRSSCTMARPTRASASGRRAWTPY